MTCQDIASTWSLRAVSVERLSPASAAYVVGYVTRKVVAPYVGKRLAPFMRMSNRPGIGASAMHDVASTILQYNLVVPSELRRGSTRLPLGRYLRSKLNEYTERELPEISAEYRAKLQVVRDFAWESSVSQREVFREINEVHASQLEQREALRRKVL